ncbi:MCBG-like protein [Mucilaginibacter sp. MD40]|uniref:pentapeptide repeat-containing protein n=1 Tax=Mucilaginibacter sp. MD40 TaxID=2029590 RepID=UPI000BAC5634|nr:pentapeptide repeat-containing protein [Mucilaginibacter sp. MD40]PAW92897.1 MCBG-like protein [Mucilaginibacter sp. MD40]
MFDKSFYEGEVFEKLQYPGVKAQRIEYENCTFKQCDLSEADFSRCKFMDCVFEDCNLSVDNLDGAMLNDVRFKACKILGVNFSKCDDFLFGVAFDGCLMDYASFAGKKLVKTAFVKCSLKEVSFTDAILTNSVFTDCDLDNAVFNHTDLSGVNFSTAYNFIIDPELNTLRKALFDVSGLPNLLTRHGIKVV